MAVLSLPYALDSASLARQLVCGQLGRTGVPAPVVDDAMIVLSELMGNALRHAHALPDGTVGVEWRLGGSVLSVAVTDGGGVTMPALRSVSESATGGRGLSIVEALCGEWGVQRDRGGRETTVWATVELASADKVAAAV